MTAPAISAITIAALTVLLFGCGRQQPKEDLTKLTREFIETSLANSPVAATQFGYHRHGELELDSMLDDFSPGAIEKQRRWYQDLRLRLQQSIDEKTLNAEDRA